MTANPEGPQQSPAARPRVPEGKRPISLANADSERLLSMVLALSSEVAVLSDELDALREVLSASGALDARSLATTPPSVEASERRAARRRALIERVLRIVLEDLDGPTADLKTVKYDELVARLSK